jgi:UDP-N-acetylglucosamine enolpyruvyl transferase
MMSAPSSLTIQVIASLVERGAGQVVEVELDRGWQRLSRRLAQEPAKLVIHVRPQLVKLAAMRGPH